MTRILVLGGDLIDLYADYQYASGVGNGRSGDYRKELRTRAKAVRSADSLVQTVADTGPGTGEKIGSAIGFGVGLAYSYATLPVVVLDGPLPFLDAAWAYSSFRMIERTTKLGGKIGKKFD